MRRGGTLLGHCVADFRGESQARDRKTNLLKRPLLMLAPWKEGTEKIQEVRGGRDRLRERIAARASWKLLLEKVFEGLASVGVARRSGGRRGAGSVRLSIRGWRGIFFDGHAEFVEGARGFRVFGRDPFLHPLTALYVRPR